jgi:hypothetical protein
MEDEQWDEFIDSLCELSWNHVSIYYDPDIETVVLVDDRDPHNTYVEVHDWLEDQRRSDHENS